MFMRKPSLNDALIMNNVRRAGAPAVDTTSTDMITRSAADDLKTQFDMAQKQRALDTSANRFNTQLGLQRNELDTNKRLADRANLTALAGLGVSGLGAYNEMQNSRQRLEQINQLRNRLKHSGNENQMLMADLLGFMK